MSLFFPNSLTLLSYLLFLYFTHAVGFVVFSGDLKNCTQVGTTPFPLNYHHPQLIHSSRDWKMIKHLWTIYLVIRSKRVRFLTVGLLQLVVVILKHKQLLYQMLHNNSSNHVKEKLVKSLMCQLDHAAHSPFFIQAKHLQENGPFRNQQVCEKEEAHRRKWNTRDQK